MELVAAPPSWSECLWIILASTEICSVLSSAISEKLWDIRSQLGQLVKEGLKFAFSNGQLIGTFLCAWLSFSHRLEIYERGTPVKHAGTSANGHSSDRGQVVQSEFIGNINM